MEERWGPELHVGLPLIDDAHHRQAELIESIERATARGASPATVEGFLLQLVRHTTDHFATEQDLMQAIGFPYYEAHVEEHDALLEHVSALLASHSAGYTHLTHDLARRLAPWLLNHVRTSDRLLGSYLLRVGWPREAKPVKGRSNEPVAMEEMGVASPEDLATDYAQGRTADWRTQLRLAQAFELGLGACRDGALPWEGPSFETPEETEAWRAGWHAEAERQKT